MPLTLIREMIKAPTALGRWLVERINAIGHGKGDGESASVNLAGRSESLLQLHETQNRVIHSIYKISISGFVAIFMILLSFTLFLIADSDTPLWRTGIDVVRDETHGSVAHQKVGPAQMPAGES